MAKEKKQESKKIDTNLQKAILDIASNLKKSFTKYSKNTREKAWKRITSSDGEREINKILLNPERQLNTFQKLTFKERMDGKKDILNCHVSKTMIEFKSYVEQRDLLEAMQWYEQAVVEKEHIPRIKSAFEILKSISADAELKLIAFYRSVKLRESSSFFKELDFLTKEHGRLKNELIESLTNEKYDKEFVESYMKDIGERKGVESYMKGLIEASKKEDKDRSGAKGFTSGIAGFR